MTMNDFLSIVNEKMEKYNLEFKYSPADEVEVIGNNNFKFIDYDYDYDFNLFKFQLNKKSIINSMQTIKCIQEVALAGEILEVLRRIADQYGTLVLR